MNARTADGRTVILPPFVVSLQVERAAGVELFQIILTTSSTLRVCLQSRAGADPDHVWDEVRAKLVRMLSDHGLSHVAVDRATEPPELSSGDKFRLVIPLVVHGRSGCWRNGDGVVLRRRGQGGCVRLHLAAITGRGSICVPCRSVAGVNRCTYWYAFTRPRVGTRARRRISSGCPLPRIRRGNSALHAPHRHADCLRIRGARCVLTVKRNQPGLYRSPPTASWPARGSAYLGLLAHQHPLGFPHTHRRTTRRHLDLTSQRLPSCRLTAVY